METKQTPTWRIILTTIIVLVCVLILSRSCQKEKSVVNYSDNSLVDSSLVATNIDTSENPMAEVSDSTDYKWKYFTHADKMSSSKNYYATVDAKDLLDFDSPYEGGSTASIVLRNRNGVTNFYLQIDKGQFITRSSGSYCRLKFDNLPPKTYEISEPADYSSDMIFIKPYREITRLLKNHKTLIIETEFYQEGSRQMEFNISNLKWNH